MCIAWNQRDGFPCFKAWALSSGYAPGLTLERLDTNGDYTPENCTWATRREQANNRRDNVRVTAFGETKTLAEWERDSRCPIRARNIKRRIKEGMAPEMAITMRP